MTVKLTSLFQEIAEITGVRKTPHKSVIPSELLLLRILLLLLLLRK
jgi:hypothetical protein